MTFDLLNACRLVAATVMGLCLMLSGGCRKGTPPDAPLNAASPAAERQPAAPFEYAQVELSDPKVRVDEEGTCWFEVNYQFVKGKPMANYLLTVRFPGTKNACLKEMAAWQLPSLQGVIKDGIVLQEPKIVDYEFVMSEAESPQNGYTDISNVLTGKLAQ